jgi:hypothetical protein
MRTNRRLTAPTVAALQWSKLNQDSTLTLLHLPSADEASQKSDVGWHDRTGERDGSPRCQRIRRDPQARSRHEVGVQVIAGAAVFFSTGFWE